MGMLRTLDQIKTASQCLSFSWVLVLLTETSGGSLLLEDKQHHQVLQVP